MAVTIGSKLGTYEVTELLGTGGMGEVYRARDTKLKRDVALKILPDAFAKDPERLARFRHEAEALAALSHTNIAGIYDLAEADGCPFLVLELVEDETLAQRLERGALAVEESLQIARQIALGVEAAHERGIIHRDLKPANIKVTKNGIVKLLDFGLAKIFESDPAQMDAAASNSPTLGFSGTMGGMILGTAAYMSPEQARGRKIDKRADVWAFGCVLYEMLTGQQAFKGETITDIIAAVVKSEPDWSLLPPSTPSIVRSVLRQCLQKEPGRRIRDIADSRTLIEDTAAEAPLATVRQRPARLKWAMLIAVPVVLVVVSLLLAVAYYRPAPDLAAVRFSIAPPENAVFSNQTAPYALSPNGSHLAMIVVSSGGSRIWVRSLDTLEARPLTGTEGSGGSALFWSPDSRFIGFFAQGKLKKIELTGGPAQTLCDAPGAPSGTWNRDGVIVFDAGTTGPLQRVSSAGGKPTPLSALDKSRGELSQMWPSFLPDGDHFLYLSRAAQSENNAIYAGSLQSKEVRFLINANSRMFYSEPGYILFVREGTLMAQPFNSRRLEIAGEPFPIAERVRYNAANGGAASLTVAENGTMAFRSEGLQGEQQLAWFDRAGKQLGTLGPLSSYRNPEISPDGTRVAVERGDPQNQNPDVWILEVMRGVSTRFTFDPAEDVYPIWSPDGNQIVFGSARAGSYKLYQKASSGGEQEQLLLDAKGDNVPRDWSSDGRYIVYTLRSAPGNPSILPLFGDKKPISYLTTSFNLTQPQLSNDGRWAAYTSNESGRYEIYIQSFPQPGGKLQVSTAGGLFPRWRRDGKELFYMAPDEKLMAVSIEPRGTSLEFSNPTPLFETRLPNGFAAVTGFRQQYDVTADGQRFLMNTTPRQAAEVPITVVLNWTAGLKK